MSDGATMSAPARACESASLTRISRVASLSTSWPLMMPQCVVGVLTETDIGNQQKARHLLLERSQGALDDAMVIVGVRTDGILVLGNAEQDHPRNTEVADRLALLHRTIDRQLSNPRHRGD